MKVNTFIFIFLIFLPIRDGHNFLNQLGVVVTTPSDNIHLYDIKSEVQITFSFLAPLIELPPTYEDCDNKTVYHIYNKINNDITSEFVSVFDLIKKPLLMNVASNVRDGKYWLALL